MSRYTGSKWKINRREGATVLGSTEKWKKRSTLPGQFPVLKKRPSDYAIQFREKQKVKRMYGMTETQFARFYKMALKSSGNTALTLLQSLEMRIDNVLYRLGFGLTRAQTRQFITHGHLKLNGKKHNIPSYIVKVGDELQVIDSLFDTVYMKEITEKAKSFVIPSWLNKLEKGGKVLGQPVRDDMDKSIRERLIVELYSR
jgi:small subunit ribosomal protein S4